MRDGRGWNTRTTGPMLLPLLGTCWKSHSTVILNCATPVAFVQLVLDNRRRLLCSRGLIMAVLYKEWLALTMPLYGKERLLYSKNMQLQGSSWSISQQIWKEARFLLALALLSCQQGWSMIQWCIRILTPTISQATLMNRWFSLMGSRWLTRTGHSLSSWMVRRLLRVRTRPGKVLPLDLPQQIPCLRHLLPFGTRLTMRLLPQVLLSILGMSLWEESERHEAKGRSEAVKVRAIRPNGQTKPQRRRQWVLGLYFLQQRERYILRFCLRENSNFFHFYFLIRF